MTKLINKFTHTEMWVADNRVEEYKAAGHKPAVVAHAEKPSEVESKPKKVAKRGK